ncbi:MAG TPA: DNA polymerase Y family protein [Caulobacteraceae bacterium]|nr:DNA polymerase Y family protein [Caulobacteraceae bacterium]
MARFVCAWSPNWAIEGWIRRHPSVSRGEAFALAGLEAGVRRLTAVDGRAAALGLFPGQKATDATALVPELIIAEADPAADAAALTKLVDWCARFSPAVAADPPDGLFLDITGVAHLWGGEAAMIDDLVRRLAAHGLTLRVAIAETPGAAWALAHFAPDRSRCENGQAATALAPLPVAALRLSQADAGQIGRLGLRSIGSVAALPRGELGRRFGSAVLKRLDQALGRAPEALTFRRPPNPWFARLAFAEPVSAPEDLATACNDIAAVLAARLEAEGQGARVFDLAFHRLDGRAERLSIALSLAGRDPAAVARLFQPLLERIDPGFGIEVVTLAARETETIGSRQACFSSSFGGGGPRSGGGAPNASPDRHRPPTSASPVLPPGGGERDDQDLSPFIDRLTNRLGAAVVWRAEAFASHAPERAAARRPPLTRPAETAWDAGRPRPVRLFRRPEPIEVIAPVPDDPPVLFRWRGQARRVRRAEGPERLAQEWWRRPFDDPAAVRDYYQVEDETGARFWLFRAGLYDAENPPRWWLHGLFG